MWLHPDLLFEVCKYLPVVDRVRYERVNRHLKSVLSQVWASQKVLAINYQRRNVAQLQRCLNCSHWTRPEDYVCDSGGTAQAKLLARCPNLVALYVDCLDDESVLQYCPRLVHVATDQEQLVTSKRNQITCLELYLDRSEVIARANLLYPRLEFLAVNGDIRLATFFMINRTIKKFSTPQDTSRFSIQSKGDSTPLLNQLQCFQDLHFDESSSIYSTFVKPKTSQLRELYFTTTHANEFGYLIPGCAETLRRVVLLGNTSTDLLKLVCEHATNLKHLVINAMLFNSKDIRKLTNLKAIEILPNIDGKRKPVHKYAVDLILDHCVNLKYITIYGAHYLGKAFEVKWEIVQKLMQYAENHPKRYFFLNISNSAYENQRMPANVAFHSVQKVRLTHNGTRYVYFPVPTWS